MTISRMQQPRQLYGLGSFVKSIGKSVKKAVKGVGKIAKSPIGKAAILGAIGFGIPGTKIGGLFGRAAIGGQATGLLGKAGIQAALPSIFGVPQGSPNMPGSPGIFGAAKNFFGGEKTLGKTLAIGALGTTAAAALQAAGLDTENPNEMPRDVESMKSYLKRGYMQLNPQAKPEEVEEFVSANTVEFADGGRVGYAEGTDKEGIESLIIPKKPKFQSEEDINKTVLGTAEIGDPLPGRAESNKRFTNLIKMYENFKKAAPGMANKEEAKELFGSRIKDEYDQLHFLDKERFEDYVKEDRANRAYGGRMGFLDGGTKYNKIVTEMYIKAGGEEGTGMDIDTFAQKYFPKMAEGGRIGYSDGTQDYSDDRQYQTWKKRFEKNPESMFVTGHENFKEYKDFYERQNKAIGGDVVDQASGIMGLPQRTNKAGVKELDLRETGGFIPPVGVKEKADDIPAMLSNNEFVFTADAVRGMGGGDVNRGAQRLYDQMKMLEKGGRV